MPTFYRNRHFQCPIRGQKANRSLLCFYDSYKFLSIVIAVHQFTCWLRHENLLEFIRIIIVFDSTSYIHSIQIVPLGYGTSFVKAHLSEIPQLSGEHRSWCLSDHYQFPTADYRIWSSRAWLQEFYARANDQTVGGIKQDRLNREKQNLLLVDRFTDNMLVII